MKFENLSLRLGVPASSSGVVESFSRKGARDSLLLQKKANPTTSSAALMKTLQFPRVIQGSRAERGEERKSSILVTRNG